MSEKIYLGSIDARNAKFQGAIREGVPDGLGFLFNVEHLLALSSWKGDTPQGPLLLFYPNGNHLIGTIRNKQLEGMALLHKASG
jgi:hypothetical protein